MSEVLASLKPYYYYLVGEGIKEIEVRKSIPKSSDWNKTVYFYMSKDEKSFATIPKEYQEKYRKHFGKVGLKFVCDRIDEYGANCYGWYRYPMEETCLWADEIAGYGQGKHLYGWHISALKIYDKAKELGEFVPTCKYQGGRCDICVFNEEAFGGCCRILTRPPQSWCYVESLGE